MQYPTTEPIFAWLNVLDDLTYYEIFGILPDAPADDVRAAFHAFCDDFHPDRHFACSRDERAAFSVVFKRATEAYLVLSDEVLRSRYDEQLAARHPSAAPGRLSPSPGSFSPRSSRAPAKVTLEDAARSASARPFARRASELLASGDVRQAKLQLVMANHLDPGNQVLEDALRQIQLRLK